MTPWDQAYVAPKSTPAPEAAPAPAGRVLTVVYAIALAVVFLSVFVWSPA